MATSMNRRRSPPTWSDHARINVLDGRDPLDEIVLMGRCETIARLTRLLTASSCEPLARSDCTLH